MKKELETVLFTARSAFRYKRIAVVTMWLMFIPAVFLISILPDQYESKAQVFVDTSTVLKPLLQGIAVAPGAEAGAETDILRRALRSRPTVEKVAEETGYINRVDNPKNREQVDELLTRMTDRINIAGDQDQHLYIISFVDRDPRMARDVVQTLLRSFVTSAAGADLADTQNAQRFLEQQVEEYSQRLSGSEQQLAKFKKENVGLLPGERSDYFQRIQNERAVLDRLQSELDVALRQRDELRRKVSGQATNSRQPIVMPSPEEIQLATTIDAQLRDLRSQLDAALLKYTEKHPEVVALRDTVNRLEERRARELSSVRATTSTSVPGGGTAIDGVLQQLQISLNTIDVQIASLSVQVERGKEKIRELEETLAAGPEVEAELARLVRDYGVTKTQYEMLLQRLESAKVSSQADSKADFKFRVVDPPRVPDRPSGPRRKVFLLVAAMMSIGAGLALALVLSIAKPVFTAQSELAAATGLRVLGVVGLAPSAQMKARAARARWAASAAAVLLVIAIGALSMVLHPASVLLRNALGMGAR